MPTYEYICEACGHELEEFQMMSAKPLTDCPECGKSTLKRLIGTGAGVIFKGSGFYETDYRSDSYNKGKSAAKSAQSTAKKEDAAPKSSASSESKSSSGGESKGSGSKKAETAGKK